MDNMMQLIIYFTSIVFFMLIVKSWINIFFVSLNKRVLRYILWTAYFLIQISIYNISSTPVLILALNIAVVFCISRFTYHGSLKRHLILSIIICTLWMIVEILVSMFLTLVGLENDSYIAGSIISNMVMLVMSIIVRHFFNKSSKLEIPNKYAFMLLLIPCFSIYIINNIFLIVSQDENYPLLPFISGVMLLIINYIIFEVYDLIAKHSENINKNLLYEQQLELCSQQAVERENQNLEIRKIHHDMNNQLLSILGLLKTEKNAEAISYIEEMVLLSKNNLAQDVSHTGNIVVDSIINSKCSLARSEGVKFNADIFMPINLSIKSGHLTIILGNLLDNAIEACRKLGDKDRFISLSISYEKEILYIIICNTYDGRHNVNSQGNLLTTKNDIKNHGIGLMSVKQAVEHYNGELVISHDDNIFKVSVIALCGLEKK